MSYIKNGWYVACWATEVRPGELFSRQLLGTPVVFFRNAEGSLVALQDQCPHRFIPLSKGTLRPDGSLECIYHGLRFDATGSCVHNPHGDGKVPAAAKVRSYQVEERHGLVWIWMGTAQADPATIPDYSVLDDTKGFATSRGYLHIDANYELMGENLLDLSHVTTLHDGYLGSPEQAGAEQEVKEESDGRLICNRWMPNVSVPRIFDMIYRRDGRPVDMWTRMTWLPPSCFLLDAGAHEAGGQREDHGWYYGVHILTPETEKTTHYHFAAAMPSGTRMTPEEEAEFSRLRRYAFEMQDKPIIDAQQAAIGDNDFWSLKPVLLSVDAGPVRMRRAIERMLKAEQDAAQTT